MIDKCKDCINRRTDKDNKVVDCLKGQLGYHNCKYYALDKSIYCGLPSLTFDQAKYRVEMMYKASSDTLVKHKLKDVLSILNRVNLT